MTKTASPSWEEIAARRYPSAESIDGDGPFASLAFCGGYLSIVLFETREDAECNPSFECGSRCDGDHGLVQLQADGSRVVLVNRPPAQRVGRAYHGYERENLARLGPRRL